MSNENATDPDDDEPGFFEKFRTPVIVVGLLAVAVAVYFAFFSKAEKPKKKSAAVTMVNIMPPPPPPPPTPPPTPPPPQPEQQKVEDKREDFVEEAKPEDAPPPESAPEEAAPLGSNIQGEGADSFGLRGKGGSGMIGGIGSGKGGGGGTKFGWYAGQVQSRVVEALGKHRRTRSASLSVKVRIWADNTGRITRATLEGTSGDPAIDRAIQSEILNGLQLQEPPPEDMPMPIVMRITAKRPN